MKKEDLKIGDRFSKLTISEFSDPKKRYCICKCDCGGTKITSSSYLIKNRVGSCGCLQKEVMKKRNTKHGVCKKGKTKTYHVWVKMRQRCNNANAGDYKWYGGRGIKVCERWNDYALFLEDMGEKPEGYSIDRVDVNGNYCPSNCKWIPKKEQAKNNQKNYDKENFLYPYKGETITLKVLSQLIGVSVDDLYLYLLRKLQPLDKVIEKYGKK